MKKGLKNSSHSPKQSHISMSKKTSLVRLEKLIEKNFPGVWLKPGSHLGYKDGEVLVSGEGATYEPKMDKELEEILGKNFKMDVFDNYADSKSSYQMGVAKEFADFLDQHGYYVEWHDAGTVVITPV